MACDEEEKAAPCKGPRFQVLQNGRVWVRKGEWDGQFSCYRFRPRKLFGVKGVTEVGLQCYKRKIDNKPKSRWTECSVLDEQTLAAACNEEGVTMSLLLLVTGDACFTPELAIQLFRSCLEHGWHIAALRRQIAELWDTAHNLSNLTGIPTGMEGVTKRLPSPQVLMRLMVAMQTWFRGYLDSVDMDTEGKVLRLDATYASAKTCRLWTSGVLRKQADILRSDIDHKF